MGAWGGGLYDGDFALDLRATIKGMLRAPLSEDELLAEIEASVGEGLDGADALDYWLVLADQLERCGIPRRDVFERAIEIIEAGGDLALLRELGADDRTVEERRSETAELVRRLREPRAAKARRPLKKPQRLLFDVGEALTWPTDGGNSINPYVPEHMLPRLGGFEQDGWGFGIVTDAGHQFRVLAYYAIKVLMWRRAERPVPELAIHCPRSRHLYGTLTEVRMKRARVERLGPVPETAMGPPPDAASAREASRRVVLGDIGLSNAFGYDAWNSWVVPGPKFAVPAPSGTPLDPEEPDQRPANDAPGGS